MRSGLCQTHLSALDFFGDIDAFAFASPMVANAKSNCFPCFPSIGDSENAHLTNPQKELLWWHWKLGIGMQQIQELMRDWTYEEPLSQRTVSLPIIKAKFRLLIIV
jgi:hypothetical protein